MTHDTDQARPVRNGHTWPCLGYYADVDPRVQRDGFVCECEGEPDGQQRTERECLAQLLREGRGPDDPHAKSHLRSRECSRCRSTPAEEPS